MLERVHFSETKHFNLSITHPEELQPVMKALGSPLRLEILRVLGTRPMNVHDIAQALGIPASTAALNIGVLEEAGLLLTDQTPGVRGMMKICSRKLDSITLNLLPSDRSREAVHTLTLPVGAYSFVEDILPTCGLASSTGTIGEEDNPRTFFIPERFSAQLLWLRQGYITYHFSLMRIQEIDVHWLEISCELCSEAPSYRDPWKSDIDLSINGVPIGVYTSPADFGGRRGLLNPDWWLDLSTQYGRLQTWRVTDTGSYLGTTHVSGATLADLRLAELPYIAVRLGVSPRAENAGGMNLFGERFGDFPQALVLRAGYSTR